jgi:hypothetical protein
VPDTATGLVATANKLIGGESLSLSSAAPKVRALASAADSLEDQIAPIASAPADALTSATRVLAVLKPSVVVDQVLTVATGLTALDIPGIQDNVNLLPQKLAALDATVHTRLRGS